MDYFLSLFRCFLNLRLIGKDATAKCILMLIHLIALLHHFVESDLLLRSDDGLAADGASVVVICPAEEALDMKNVIDIALECNNLVVIHEIQQADGALVTQMGDFFIIRLVLGLLLFPKLLLSCLGEASLELEEDTTHAYWIDAKIN